MSNAPPVEFHPGMEVVPGYTLIAPLGSGMAGDVWQAQAAGGIKVALKVVRNLKDLGGRKELKALKTIRDVHHPNLCPLFGFWTKDADGRVLADGETEDLTFDSVSAAGVGMPASPAAGSPASAADSGNVAEMGGTMAIGAGMPYSAGGPGAGGPGAGGPGAGGPGAGGPGAGGPGAGGPGAGGSGAADHGSQGQPAKPKVTAEQLIVVMGLGDCTLYDRLKFVRQEAGLSPDAHDTPYGLDAAETIRYLRASASAIDLLNQEHQIYHCDIKPQNILLVGGEAQVCDFGLAKQMEGDMRQTQQAFATPAYAPPEVLHNEGYSRQVDQYSLAVTYYELRTGLLPFDITTHASMLVAKSTGKLNLDALTPAERKVLQKALRRVPSERYGSCTEFINAMAVASGVEKSGGITIGRIISAVAVLVAAVGIGIGIWSVAHPESFNSVFRRSAIEVAKDLQEVRASYERTEPLVLEESHVTLTEVMSRSAEIGAQSEGELKAKADALFADAAARLINKIHAALKQYEERPSLAIAQKEINSMTSCLDELVIAPEKPESPIWLGLQRWQTSDDELLNNACAEYLSLYHAAAIRFDLLLGTRPLPDRLQALRQALPQHLQSLRQSLEERPGDFSQQSIDLTLASLLPVLATMPPQEIKTWTAEAWLEEARLSDLIRAESVVRQFGPYPLYSQRWSEIRETFTVAVEPAVTETVATDATISRQTKQRVLDGFPDLRTEKQFAELRTAVQQSDWNEVERLLAELRLATSINSEQKAILAVIGAMAEHRSDDQALEQTLTSINGADLSPVELREMRAQPLLASFMRAIGRRILDNPDRSATRFYTQIKSARWVERELDTPVPEAFLSAAAISLLRESPELISDPAGRTELDLDGWLSLLDGSPQSAVLAAAIRMERQIAAPSADPAVVAAANQVLTSSGPGYLQQISNGYANYLSACAACLQNQDLGPLGEQLATTARESIESLGPTRLYKGTEMFVRQAIATSGIADDEITSLRYSEGSTNAFDVSRARSYLELAETLVRSTDQGLPTVLENELFLQSVASGTVGASAIVIPRLINDRLDSAESTAELSTQLLRAVHRIGLQRWDQAGDTKAKGEVALRLLIRPARALLERFGRDRFGPRTLQSNPKGVLIRMVVLPTITDVVEEALRFNENQLLPSGFKPEFQWPIDEVTKLCQLAAVAYTDPLTRSEFQDQDLFRRQQVAISAIAAQDATLADAETRQYLIEVAMAAVDIRSCDGNQLLTLADKLSRSGKAEDVIQFLRSEGYERLANASATREERGGFLRQAHDAAESVLSQPPTQVDADQPYQRRLLYEVFAKSADLGVRLAFLQKSIPDKLRLLQPSLKRADRALDLYDEQWGDDVHCPIVSAYITKGNVCEDIAHYCSIADDQATVKQREEHFRLAIAAFTEAKNKNDQDLKTRFSLGRCEYRWALTLDGSAKDNALADASKSLGARPADVASLNDVEANKAAEWYVWKINVEWERGNQNDALQFALAAVPLVGDDLVHLSIRSDLARKCAWVMAKSSRLSEAIECLRILDGRGDTVDVIMRMGLLSDIAFFRNCPDKELFTVPLRILDRSEKQPTLREDDDATYELAKIATRCVREQLTELIPTVPRKTASKPEDLSIGPRELDARLDRDQGGSYRQLSQVFLQGDTAARNRDADAIFRFACELAAVSDTIPQPPAYVEDQDYITNNLCLTVLYSLNYWVKEIAGQDALKIQQSQRDASQALADGKHEQVIRCLDFLKISFQQAGNRRYESIVDDAIKMVNELKNSPN